MALYFHTALVAGNGGVRQSRNGDYRALIYFQYLGSAYFPRLQLTQCLVCLLQGKYLNFGLKRHVSRQAQKFLYIATGNIGDALYFLFLPQV